MAGNTSIPNWHDTATEEWKLLQSIISRLENNEYKIRGWLLALLTALAVGLFSNATRYLSTPAFVFMAAIVIILFLFIELIHRIPKRRAMNRVRCIEESLRGKSEYDGPMIAAELSQQARAVPMLNELIILPVYGFYILIIVIVVVLAAAADRTSEVRDGAREPPQTGARQLTDATVWTAVGSVATGFGALIAGVGVMFTAWHLTQSKRIARADCLLHLEELLAKHTEINLRLRPSGDWGKGKGGPDADEEWASVEAYMGLFERVNALIDEGILSIEYVEYFYGYRVTNLADNPVIREAKLQGTTAKFWTGFTTLDKRVRQQRNARLKN